MWRLESLTARSIEAEKQADGIDQRDLGGSEGTTVLATLSLCPWNKKHLDKRYRLTRCIILNGRENSGTDLFQKGGLISLLTP